jgi:beta-lactamase regulating signal transducer with metallopeptidase domain
VTPHSFLRYIFINENDFYSGRLEPEVLQHELAHARQRHSYDILLMEILQALLWFNPFIFLYSPSSAVGAETSIKIT